MRASANILAALLMISVVSANAYATEYVPLVGFFGTDILIPIETCTDNDSDGYGNPASSACTYPDLDCDDSDPSTYPGAPEICDTLDNQCPGDPGYEQVDEGCPSSCAATATSSTLRVDRIYGPSDLGRHLVCFLLPVCALMGVRGWRKVRLRMRKHLFG